MTGQERVPGPDELLTTTEVARLFKVDPKTVSRWELTGRLTAIRTPGGHRRFRGADVRKFLVFPERADPPPVKWNRNGKGRERA